MKRPPTKPQAVQVENIDDDEEMPPGIGGGGAFKELELAMKNFESKRNGRGVNGQAGYMDGDKDSPTSKDPTPNHLGEDESDKYFWTESYGRSAYRLNKIGDLEMKLDKSQEAK